MTERRQSRGCLETEGWCLAVKALPKANLSGRYVYKAGLSRG